MESGVLSFDCPCRKDAREDKDPPEGNGACLFFMESHQTIKGGHELTLK